MDINLPSLADVEIYRSRELRNLLIQKLGVNPDRVARLIDRQELKELARSILQEQEDLVFKHSANEGIRNAFMVILLIISLYIFRKPISDVLVAIMEVLFPERYRLFHKAKQIKFHYRRAYWISMMAMILSLSLEFFCSLIQVSTLLSWVVSRDNPLRRFLIPSLLSIPVGASTLLAPTGIAPSGALQALGSFNVDIGPMITLFVLRWIVGKLEEFSSATVLAHNAAKEDRRLQKLKKRSSNSSSVLNYAGNGNDEDDCNDEDGDHGSGLSGRGAASKSHASLYTSAEEERSAMSKMISSLRGSSTNSPLYDSHNTNRPAASFERNDNNKPPLPKSARSTDIDMAYISHQQLNQFGDGKLKPDSSTSDMSSEQHSNGGWLDDNGNDEDEDKNGNNDGDDNDKNGYGNGNDISNDNVVSEKGNCALLQADCS